MGQESSFASAKRLSWYAGYILLENGRALDMKDVVRGCKGQELLQMLLLLTDVTFLVHAMYHDHFLFLLLACTHNFKASLATGTTVYILFLL